MLLMLSLVSQAYSPADPAWRMFKHDYQRTGRTPGQGAFSTGTLIWKYLIEDADGGEDIVLYSTPAFKDINSDARMEVLVGSPGSEKYDTWGDYEETVNEGIYVFNYNGYQAKLRGQVVRYSSPAIGDLDGDGVDEIAVGASSDEGHSNGFWILNQSGGTELWINTGNQVASSPALCDVDNDGLPEIFVGIDNDIRCYEWTGSGYNQRWSFPTGAYVQSSPALGDLDGNGTYELVCGSDNGNIYCLNALTGSQIWAYQTGKNVRSTPAIDNITSSPGLEIVYANDSAKVGVLSAGGSLLFLRSYPGPDTTFNYSSPSTGDFTGDGFAEVVIHDAFSSKIDCIDVQGGGSNFFSTSLGATYYFFDPTPAVGRFTGDNTLDVATVAGVRFKVISGGGYFGSPGTIVWDWGNAEYAFHTSVSFGDADGDGLLEASSSDLSCWVYLWDGTGPLVADETRPVRDFCLGFSPNPTRGKGNIALLLPEPCLVRILVYDAKGALVFELAEELASGAHNIPVVIEKPGVYILRAIAGERVLTDKFTVTR
ncbi:MAG: FG-GAP-like repeat-containing protein [candidate division WOR-3 bacterium]